MSKVNQKDVILILSRAYPEQMIQGSQTSAACAKGSHGWAATNSHM